MKELSIDIETYCEVDIKTAGAYKYAEKSEIILFGYSEDKAPPKCVDLLSGERIPDHIIAAMMDKTVRKTAHNAPFELENISQALGLDLDADQWRCSAVLAAIAGYPMSLDEASKALGTAEKKDSEGKALIRYFCVPCKPTKANGMRTRNYPHHAPEKWAKFIEYCKQDVVTEQAICDKLDWVELPEIEHKLWVLDQKINKRGWKVDMELARCAIELDGIFREKLTLEAKKLTGLSNPNSVAQLKDWFVKQGLIIPKAKIIPVGEREWGDTSGEAFKGFSLSKPIVQDLLKKVESGDLDYVLEDVDAVKRMLEIRLEMSKTSIKKYTSMINAAGKGDRVRGLFQFCGAGRTWRWAGRLVQVQNLPRILLNLKELMLARELVKSKDMDMIELCFGSVSNILSQLIRTAFISEKGKRLLILDFSAIEAVILAWLAGETWRLDIFKGKGNIYEASASTMFKLDINTITKGHENYSYRAKGKVAELACGYQGGVPALEKMGALDMGLTKRELPFIIKKWREASPNIVKLWYAMQRSAIAAIKNPGEYVEVGTKNVKFVMRKGSLLLYLPSGRCLHYPRASVEEVSSRIPIMEERIAPDGDPIMVQTGSKIVIKEVIFFWGINQTTRKWEKQSTYGGKLVENLTQATARDCLANGMLNMDDVGIDIDAHVHDEVAAEMPLKITSIQEMKKLMLKPAPWMDGIPLRAEGDESLYYNK